MDFLTLLALYATSQWLSEEDMNIRHQNYCQNLYFQPDAENKMNEARCDIFATGEEISRVKSGKY